MAAPLEFWFEFASTYTYPAVVRASGLAAEAGVSILWRPFLLGPIFGAQGWNDSPFNIYPAKGRYMWRDLERICAREGIPLKRPSVFPRNGLLAARVATLAEREGWCEPFVRAVFHANFAEDREIAKPEVVRQLLADLERDGDEMVERALAPENKQRLRDRTDEAVKLEIFGAPSFRVGGELFWGNDRLEEALAWAKR